MPQNRSREDLVRFLDYTGEKGLVPPATAAARRTAATKVLAVLSDEEALDVVQINLDDIMSRFDNLNKHQFTPDSLQTYRSRLKTSLRDFESYCENPVNFRPLGASRTKAKPATERLKNSIQPTRDLSIVQSEIPFSTDLPNVAVLPIPLRQNLTVRVVGLPFDLTPNEARKIANIILAHSNEE